MNTQTEIHPGQRFINEHGLVKTIVQINIPLENITAPYKILFDDKQNCSYWPENKIFVGNDDNILIIEPFAIEEGKLYLTVEGYEYEFKIITDENNKIIYVSDEGSQYSSDGKVILSEGFGSFFMIAGENNEHVKSILQERKFKQSDFVDVKVVEQEAIPPNNNAFHFDLSNMGTMLIDGWIIMHAGPSRQEDPRPVQYLILVNQISGQRIKLEFTKR